VSRSFDPDAIVWPEMRHPFRIHVRGLDTSVGSDGRASVYAAIRSLLSRRSPRGCAQGGCGLCAVRLIAGEVVLLGPMSASKLAVGGPDPARVLACRIASASDLVIELGESLLRLSGRPVGASDIEKQ
jgi:3-phenylpropionate/trans-cinnamate dioxygenase ferredoxin reductase subunit